MDREGVLDELDKTLVRALRTNPDLSNRALARHVHVSEATARKRIRRLTDLGVITRALLINPYRVGYMLDTIIGMQVEIRRIKEIAASVAEFDNVRMVAMSSGSYDIMIAALFQSQDHLINFVSDELGMIDGIRRIDTAHLLKVVKRTHDWIPEGPTTDPFIE